MATKNYERDAVKSGLLLPLPSKPVENQHMISSLTAAAT